MHFYTRYFNDSASVVWYHLDLTWIQLQVNFMNLSFWLMVADPGWDWPDPTLEKIYWYDSDLFRLHHFWIQHPASELFFFTISKKNLCCGSWLRLTWSGSDTREKDWCYSTLMFFWIQLQGNSFYEPFMVADPG